MTTTDLRTYLALNAPLAPKEAISLLCSICEPLAALHQQGARYQRLRPESIALSGTSHAVEPQLLDEEAASSDERAAPTSYDAPEVAQGGAGDARSDVYALGAILFEALCGRPLPRPNDSAPPPEMPGDSVYLLSLINRCLRPDPAARYADAAELAKSLREASAPPAPPELADTATGAAPIMLVSEETREKPGDVLGSYELVALLGEGTMGRVYSARHTRLGRQVAIKVLRLEHARNPGVIRRFFQEARAVNRINHENIVEIFDFVHEPGPNGLPRVYCVMELLEGESLEALLRREPPAVDRTLRIARQVCAALHAAHQVGVVHRDIKPDNIFLSRRGRVDDFVKVLDFGVAKLLTPSGDLESSQTQHGAVIGTPDYMPPEQAAGRQTDARTDVYAIGAVLYQVLCGHAPFAATAFGDLLVEIITKPAPPLGKATPAGELIPAGLRALVMQCLEKDPAKRPASMEALEAALAQIERGHVPGQRQRSRVGAVVGAALFVAAAALGYVSARQWLVPPAHRSAQARAAQSSRPTTVIEDLSRAPRLQDPEPAAPEPAPSAPVEPEQGSPQPSPVTPASAAEERTQIRPLVLKQQSKKAVRQNRRLSRDAVIDPLSD